MDVKKKLIYYKKDYYKPHFFYTVPSLFLFPLASVTCMDNKFLAVFLDHYITSFISQVIIKIVDTEIHSFIIETHLGKELM